MSEFNEFDQQGSVPRKDTGNIISHAFEMYKGVFLYAMIAMIVYIIGGGILQAISGFNSTSFIEEVQSSSRNITSVRYWDMPGFSLYSSLSGLLTLLLTPLYVGLIYIINKYNTKNTIEFSDLFIGYKQNFLNILIYSLISGFISGITFGMCFLPFIFVFPFLLLGYPILLFENATAIEALGKSFSIAKENYGTFLGVSLLGLLISFCGVFLCGIGIIATAPFIMAVMYSTYCAYCGKPRQIIFKG
ncbi:beta-carotene 15,15'-monooxygenase [Chryseobacterium sp.]|uniref:beta-carotene 15,15'-monooxygenase n=1 Tax=Chryseobacterium sp. TaxID=1871047 RepID=UPI0025BD8445|nr:beta-carotene 15,15'-monooxygenase [Chryseobacterium sp.]